MPALLNQRKEEAEKVLYTCLPHVNNCADVVPEPALCRCSRETLTPREAGPGSPTSTTEVPRVGTQVRGGEAGPARR